MPSLHVDQLVPSLKRRLPASKRGQLGGYLRDHYAGSAAGWRLARRCRVANEGTAFELAFARLEREIEGERTELRNLMERLDVSPSTGKSFLGAGAELVGRLKRNGTWFRYSPSSRVVELELLAAGVLSKRNLWRSLLAISDEPALDAAPLAELADQASAQLDLLLESHAEAVTEAFAEEAVGDREPA